MGEVEILHRIFTNAAEGDVFEPARARIVTLDDGDASTAMSKGALDVLDELLTRTAPIRGQHGWVVRRFATADGRSYACVIVSYPDLVEASDERRGVLNHARLVVADHPSFDAAALIEMALEFPMADVRAEQPHRRLQKYLDVLSGEAVALRDASLSELQTIPRGVMADILLGCLTGHQRVEGVRISMTDAGPAMIARAWAALPRELQRTSSWALEVQDGCPVDVIFAEEGRAPAIVASPPLTAAVLQYVSLLHDAPETFGAMIGNAGIAGVTAFASAVQKAALAPQLSSIETSGKGEMAKKDKAPKVNPRRERDPEEWRPLDDDARVEIDRQFKAIERSLQIALDERLSAFEARLEAQGVVRGAAAADDARVLRRLGWSAGMVIVALMLGAGLWYLWTAFAGRSRTNTVAPETEEATTRQQPPAPAETGTTKPVPTAGPVRNAVIRAESSRKWAEELKAIVEAEPRFVAELVSETSDRAAIPSAMSKELLDFAERIEAKRDLGAEGRRRLRFLLVDCIASEIEETDVKIDGDVADATKVLAEIKERHSVASKEKDLAQMALQSEIILRWMAGRER